ncbi:ATP-binding protein [Hylemonella gracilis]|uniref:ATP-binding protein n=1 Tax=Hylemonella gracilis TaxID=80880 RepID=UPI0009DF0821|nr:ATP-binding protein [Hylemonella gracilis]
MKTKATYTTDGLPEFYLNNPLIEALPSIMSRDELESTLLTPPSASVAEARRLPPHLRIHAMSALDSLFVPRPELVAIESEIGLLMRSGYLRRNPTLGSTTKEIYTARERMRMQGGQFSPLPPCLMVTALSGSGKSRSIRSILSLTPQVIRHTRYAGKPFSHTQITWLSLDAPINGSPRGLLLRAFAAVDRALGLDGPASYVSQYGRVKMSVDQKIEEFAQIATTFHLGLLHIDDLQRLTEAGRKQGSQVLNLLIQLANVVKVPLVFSGTHQMARVIAGSLEAARRSSSGGIEDLPLPKTSGDVHFRLLVKALSTHQYMDEPVPFDQSWEKKLFELSLGLPAVLISVVTQAQKIALREGARRLELDHLDQAFEKNCGLLKPALQALRSEDPNRFLIYEDLLPSKTQLAAEHARIFKSTRPSTLST